MADRYMHEVLTPAVLEAQEKYYGRRYSTEDEAPSGEALRDQELEMISYDWNCPKFITPRFTAGQIQDAVAPLQDRIAELEAQLRSLKS